MQALFVQSGKLWKSAGHPLDKRPISDYNPVVCRNAHREGYTVKQQKTSQEQRLLLSLLRRYSTALRQNLSQIIINDKGE